MLYTVLENDRFCVEIGLDSSFALDSADNKRYDKVYNPCALMGRDMYQTLSLFVDGEKSLELALIVDARLTRGDFAVLEGGLLTILHFDHITRIDLNTELIQSAGLDVAGETFSLYRLEVGYLVHGECEIIRLNDDLAPLWTFSGYDVFVSISGKSSLELTRRTIRLNDFSDNYYELDYDGNVLRAERENQG